MRRSKGGSAGAEGSRERQLHWWERSLGCMYEGYVCAKAEGRASGGTGCLWMCVGLFRALLDLQTLAPHPFPGPSFPP